jgi:sulfur carrier protein ThiS
MRSLLRAGLALGLITAACGKDSPAPTDFEDPAAITANLAAADSAFDSDVFRSFNAATLFVDAAAPAAPQLTSTVVGELRPKLARAGAQMVLPTLERSRRLQALLPQLSAASAAGLLIPDSLYNRVFQWDTATNQYTWTGTTTTGLTGIRFELYAVDLAGTVLEPVTQIGTLDIIDQSVGSTARLRVLVRDLSAVTYVDYLATVSGTETSATISVEGSISNGLADPDNKTLTFDQTFAVTQTGVRINATFTLNNPALTVTLIESLGFDDPNIVVDVDFRIAQPGETIRMAGRITITDLEQVTGTFTVYRNGGPVASISGDLSDPATQWVDAGGEPLTLADRAALDALFDAMDAFVLVVTGFFAPITTFGGGV